MKDGAVLKPAPSFFYPYFKPNDLVCYRTIKYEKVTLKIEKRFCLRSGIVVSPFGGGLRGRAVLNDYSSGSE